MPKQARPLVLFGCVHIGHRSADLDMAKRYVDWVKKHDAFALLLSDNFEAATVRKAHMMFDQDMTPQEQLDYAVELYRPIAKNIVGAVTGNHAARILKDTGVDVDKELAHRLGILSKYYFWQGYIKLTVGSQTYSVAFEHGHDCPSGNPFKNGLNLASKFPMACIYATSHTHRLAIDCSQACWVCHQKLHPSIFVSTGSTLNYPNYAAEAGYKPQQKGFPILWLHSDQHYIEAQSAPAELIR